MILIDVAGPVQENHPVQESDAADPRVGIHLLSEQETDSEVLALVELDSLVVAGDFEAQVWEDFGSSVEVVGYEVQQ